MAFRDLIGDVLRTLWVHKLRTSLTMFGIAWGIVSIVLVVAAGEGLRVGQQKQAETLGKDIMIVFHGRTSLQAGGQRAGREVHWEDRDIPNVYIREIGLRRALGAKKYRIQLQFLAETLMIMLFGGALGIILSYLIAAAVGTLPMMGPLFEDTSGKGDIHLQISLVTILTSTAVLLFVGLLSGLVPAMRAAKLDPVEALRYE